MGGWGGGWMGGQGGCERRIEVFCENSKKKLFLWGGGVSVGLGGGVRVGVNEEFKFFTKIQKKNGGGVRVGLGGGGSGWM